MYKYIFYVLALFLSFTTSAQEIEKKWQLSSSNKDYLELKGGSYELHISSDSLKQKGDYLVQDNNSDKDLIQRINEILLRFESRKIE